MSTLPHARVSDQWNLFEDWPDDDPPRPAPDAGPDPDPTTDLAWLADEAVALAKTTPDPLGAHALAGSAACDLVQSLRFHRHDSAAAYLADRNTPVSAADLAACRPPAAPYRSPLAAALADLAAWYNHDGGLAGELLAHALLMTAAEVEHFGSADLDEYQIDEAAWRAAALDAVCDGRLF